LYLGFVVWVFYLALEPYVRRYWKESLISWSRLLLGGFRDPLVGRDILVGVLIAVAAEILMDVNSQLAVWLDISAFARKSVYTREMLLGFAPARTLVAEVCLCVAWSLFVSLVLLLSLFLLRLLLRKGYLAYPAFVVLWTLVFSPTEGHPG